MILIPMIESTDKILGEMPELINKLEKNSPDTAKESAGFIKSLEAAAEKYRLPIAPNLSVIRGKILCGSPAAAALSGCAARKEQKAQEKRFILSQLQAANDCINNYFADTRKIFDECERLVCQILVRMNAKGYFNERGGASLSGEELIKLASGDGELAPISVHVIGLIGMINTKILFEKTMSLAGIY